MSLIRVLLETSSITSKAQLLDSLRRLVAAQLVGTSIVNEIDRYSEPDILQAVTDTLSANQPTSVSALRSEEFAALRDAATRGAPPQASSTPGAPHQFEVVRDDVRQIPTAGGHTGVG